MAVTVKDVARYAGVSPQTVSNVVNNRPFVRPETREKVLKACGVLEYHPNAAARSLVTRRRHIIGIVLTNLRNPIYGEVVETLTTVAEKYGYSVIVGNSRREAGSESRISTLLVEQRVDGVLLSASTWDSHVADIFRNADIPAIHLLNHPQKAEVDYYGADNRGGVRLTTAHLISLGHVSFGFVRGPLNSSISIQREMGFRDAMRSAGLVVNPRWLAETDYTHKGSLHATRLLLERTPRPTAIVCASDLMALGVIDAAWERGIDVPRDLAVVGFDDMPLASLGYVGLTTVRFDLEGLVELAVVSLLAKISGESRHEPPRYVVKPCELIVRTSCGAKLEAMADKGPK